MNSVRELSEEGIRLAARSSCTDLWELAGLLYRFNRAPVSPKLRRYLSDEPSCLRTLGLSYDGMSRQGRRCLQLRLRISPEGRGWRTWINSRPKSAGPSEARYKVYVSPLLQDLPGVFEQVLVTAPEYGASSLKIGSNLFDLVRCDKLMIYFNKLSGARDYARDLSKRLSGAQPQGVPFTHQIGATSLLSLGVDPPPRSTNTAEHGSWRTWVCVKIAKLVLQTRREDLSRDPLHWVLGGLEQSGIATARWLPERWAWNE
jgi:hypothetical protein